MKYLVKYMCELDTNNDVTAEASWTPSYKINDILSLSKYEIKILNVIKKSKEGLFDYLVKVINTDFKIPIIMVNEDALDGDYDNPDVLRNYNNLLTLIKRLIQKAKTKFEDKKFEKEFTLKQLNAIYKKSK